MRSATGLQHTLQGTHQEDEIANCLRRHRTALGEITQYKGHYAVQGRRFGYQLILIYLAPFSLYLAIPLAFNPPTEGFPWDDLRKIFRWCQRMVKLPNGVETLLKISTSWVGCTNVTDDSRTGDSIANVNVRYNLQHKRQQHDNHVQRQKVYI